MQECQWESEEKCMREEAKVLEEDITAFNKLPGRFKSAQALLSAKDKTE